MNTGSSNGNYFYSYAPGNKRVWKGTTTYDSGYGQNVPATDEITFWSPGGQKLGTYNLVEAVTTSSVDGSRCVTNFSATQTGTNYYFGGKLIKNAPGAVFSDRLGSVGQYYPYGTDKGSGNPSSGEKFTGYQQDSETGLDYADQRYQQPGAGRFLTADRYTASASPGDPGTWNKYSYTAGDPVNRLDRRGNQFCAIDSYNGGVPLSDQCNGNTGACVGGNDPSNCLAEMIAIDETTQDCNGNYGVALIGQDGTLASNSGPCAPTQQVSSIIPCSDMIPAGGAQYYSAVLYILDENSYNSLWASSKSYAGSSSSQITWTSLAREDSGLASILVNRVNDQAHFGVGGTNVNAQACAAYSGGPNTVTNGRVGCARLVNGRNAYRKGIDSNYGSADCANLLGAFNAILSVMANGTTNSATYNWGLDTPQGQPGPSYLKGKVLLNQVDDTLFFGLQ